MGRPWTPAEDRLLRDAAATNLREGVRPRDGSRLRQLAERLGRTYYAVTTRASEIGAHSLDPERTVRRNEQRARDQQAAREKALDRAGFPRRHTRPWTPEDDATIAARHGEGSGTLAAYLGRSRVSVQKRASRLAISLGKPRRPGSTS